jgi:hypothetical protein
MHAMGAKERIRNLYLRGGRINLWAIMAVITPAMVYAREIIHLYVGDRFVYAAWIMICTLAAYVIAGGASMVWGVAHAMGNIRPIGIRNLVSQLTAIGISLYLVGVAGWGALGPAYASLAVGCIANVVLIWPLGLRLADVTFETWIRKTLFPGLAPAATGAIIWAVLKWTVVLDSWSKLGLCGLLGGLGYAVVLLRFCLAPQDRADLAGVIARIRPWTDWQRFGRKGA